jgi:uncharacterized oligopeptide transporter (OPT) family protein
MARIGSIEPDRSATALVQQSLLILDRELFVCGIMAPRAKSNKKNDASVVEGKLIQILLWGVGILLVLSGLAALFVGVIVGWVVLIPGLIMIICAVLGARR